MNKITKDIDCLNKSISHWYNLMIFANDEKPTATQCALCREYSLETNSCKQCPLFIFTKISDCGHYIYYDASREWDLNKTKTKTNFCIKNMYNFLIKVRDALLEVEESTIQRFLYNKFDFVFNNEIKKSIDSVEWK